MASAKRAALGALVGWALLACGGKDKPPMTPDPDVNMMPDLDAAPDMPAQPQAPAPMPSDK